jgi:hypothetical protein
VIERDIHRHAAAIEQQHLGPWHEAGRLDVDLVLRIVERETPGRRRSV